MKMKFTFLILLFFVIRVNSQNMYSLSGWTVGTGNITDFGQYGASASNNRELGNNHIGSEVVLWKATPNPTSIAEGGIYANYKSIDNTKTYRLSIWIKKTNSQDGRTFFGCHSNIGTTHHTLKLDGTLDANPYFWYGDLPKLNHWYLLVGYVHPHDYTGVSLGNIYDGETGEAVLNTFRDYKFSPTATNLRMRAFLYDDPNLDDRQYLYKPVMEELTSASPSINRLLGINEGSTIMFDYDTAGNQIKRLYCEYGTSCSFPSRPSNQAPILDVSQIKREDNFNSKDEITIFPNPTSGKVTIHGQKELHKLTTLIMVYDSKGVLIQQIVPKNNALKIQIDLSNQSSGLYFIHMHFKDGGDITKKIIKE